MDHEWSGVPTCEERGRRDKGAGAYPQTLPPGFLGSVLLKATFLLRTSSLGKTFLGKMKKREAAKSKIQWEKGTGI